MTKHEILEFFAHRSIFISPDQLLRELKLQLDRRSLYSYLRRLKGQGLLETGPDRKRGYLVYRITGRGRARLEYFRSLTG
jgi:DNA-binding PadR family transcriptional regulator